MTSDGLLRERQAECKKCGAPIEIPLSENVVVLKCTHCPCEYEYDPMIKTVAKLIFERGDRSSLEHELAGSIIIGRVGDFGYIKIKSALDESIAQNTYVRNPYVSREHAKILVKKDFRSINQGDTRKIVVKKKCLVKDLRSKFGTKVNNVLLRPGELRELRNNDKIVLAANSDLHMVIFYREQL